MTVKEISRFQQLQKKLPKAGLFLTYSDHDDEYVLGETKNKKKWEKILEECDRTNKWGKCPIMLFKSLDEIWAAAVGYSVAKRIKLEC